MFLTIIVVAIFVPLTILLLVNGLIFILPFILPIPFFTFLFLVHLPSLVASSRAGGLEGELPYTTAYLSTMVMGGLSPYSAFERVLRSRGIFRKSAEIVQRFILLTKVLGKDPLTAFSMLADRTPSPLARDLLSGYVTTVRAGGDVIDYLNKKARLMFSEILVKMKIAADRLGGILESYLAVVLLSLITLIVMYFVTVSFAGVVPFGISVGSFFLVIYILLPFISVIVIYLADLIQYKEAWIDYRPYMFFFSVSVPLIIMLSIFGVILPLVPNPLQNVFTGLYRLLILPAKMFHAQEYLYPATALSMVFIIGTIPSVIYTAIVSSEYKVVDGITRFLRDLVEVRKTGISPERSIMELSNRNYGVFTKYLKRMALQLGLGVPLSKIIEDLNKRILVWRAKVLLFTLTDAIEVGGGTIETMESLASFAESVEAIDSERRKTMRTLLLIPYLGAVLSAVTVILLTVYMGSLAGIVPAFSAAYRNAAIVTLPAIVLNNFFMGLVAGKISGGSVAAGFKHALTLVTVTLLTIVASGFISISPPAGPTT